MSVCCFLNDFDAKHAVVCFSACSHNGGDVLYNWSNHTVALVGCCCPTDFDEYVRAPQEKYWTGSKVSYKIREPETEPFQKCFDPLLLLGLSTGNKGNRKSIQHKIQSAQQDVFSYFSYLFHNYTEQRFTHKGICWENDCFPRHICKPEIIIRQNGERKTVGCSSRR